MLVQNKIHEHVEHTWKYLGTIALIFFLGKFKEPLVWVCPLYSWKWMGWRMTHWEKFRRIEKANTKGERRSATDKRGGAVNSRWSWESLSARWKARSRRRFFVGATIFTHGLYVRPVYRWGVPLAHWRGHKTTIDTRMYLWDLPVDTRQQRRGRTRRRPLIGVTSGSQTHTKIRWLDADPCDRPKHIVRCELPCGIT